MFYLTIRNVEDCIVVILVVRREGATISKTCEFLDENGVLYKMAFSRFLLGSFGCMGESLLVHLTHTRVRQAVAQWSKLENAKKKKKLKI